MSKASEDCGMENEVWEDDSPRPDKPCFELKLKDLPVHIQMKYRDQMNCGEKCEEKQEKPVTVVTKRSADCDIFFDSSSCSKSLCNVPRELLRSRLIRGGRSLMITNLPENVVTREVKQMFAKFGKISRCYVARQPKKAALGYAYIDFAEKSSVDEALKFGKFQLKGRILIVSRAMTHIIKKTPLFDPSTHNVNRDAEDDSVFGRLDDLSLLKVFTFLSNVNRIIIERVCKRWLCVSRSSWASKKVLILDSNWHNFGGIPEKAVRRYISGVGRNVEEIDFSQSPSNVGDYIARQLSVQCSVLASLDLSGTSISNYGLGRIVRKCSKLRIVKIRNCHKISEQGIYRLFFSLPKLHEVELSSLKITGQKAFLKIGKSLVKLTISSCNQLRDDAIEQIVGRCELLEYLDVNHCAKLTHAAIQRLSALKAKLQTLNLSSLQCTDAMTASLSASITQLSNLQTLDVSFNASITDAVLLEISSLCKRLRCVKISGKLSGATDKAVVGFSHCPQLEVIHISYMSKVTDEALRGLAHHANNLRFVEMRACFNVTDEGVAELAEHCRYLAELDISGCHQLSHAAIVPFIEANRTSHGTVHITVGGTKITNSDNSDITAEFRKNPRINLNLINLSCRKYRPDTDGYSLSSLEADFEDQFYDGYDGDDGDDGDDEDFDEVDPYDLQDDWLMH